MKIQFQKIAGLSFFFIIFLCHLNLFAAPASAYVELSDLAYRDVEKLVSFGLCAPPMIDQRPFLRSEFERMLSEATKKYEKIYGDLAPAGTSNLRQFSSYLARKRYIKAILERLSDKNRTYPKAPSPLQPGADQPLADVGEGRGEGDAKFSVHPLEKFRIDANFLSSAPLVIVPNNGLGSINAQVNPLLNYNEGRHAIDGFEQDFETEHYLQLTKYFALKLHPRLEANIWRGNNPSYQDENSVLLQEGYSVFQIGDFAVTLGRSTIAWGPSEHGGLLLTNNARPLDQIQISTPSPFRLPWVFKHLGTWRISLFGANLGPEYNPKYTWLTGYRLSYMPVRYLELGFGNVTMMGGDGMPDLSAWEIFGEFWGFRPAGTASDSPNKSNHLMEASLLARIPPLWGLTLYGVLMNDDKRDTIKRFLRDGSGYLAGIYLPRLNPKGTADLRLEYRNICAVCYRHGIYTEGYTLNNLLIGDNLGPNSTGFCARASYDFSPKLVLKGSFDWEKRGSSLYNTTLDPDGSLGDIVLADARPYESRYRFAVEPVIKMKGHLKVVIKAGYEHVLNAGYVEGVSKNNWLLGFLLSIDTDDFTRFER